MPKSMGCGTASSIGSRLLRSAGGGCGGATFTNSMSNARDCNAVTQSTLSQIQSYSKQRDAMQNFEPQDTYALERERRMASENVSYSALGDLHRFSQAETCSSEPSDVEMELLKQQQGTQKNLKSILSARGSALPMEAQNSFKDLQNDPVCGIEDFCEQVKNESCMGARSKAFVATSTRSLPHSDVREPCAPRMPASFLRSGNASGVGIFGAAPLSVQGPYERSNSGQAFEQGFFESI